MGISDDDTPLADSVLAEVARGLAAPAVEGWNSGVAPEQRYQLGDLLGKGGMATVHAATDTVLGRPVALKFVRDENPILIARLQREARAQARIEHPNICRVYDVGTLGGSPFIAMQRIDGRPLGVVAPTLTVPERVRIVRDVALAVHAAHAAGLVHRDLKPANVLVDADGKPYVMDFGIARETSDATLTMTGQVIGTPQYMAPEQAAGKTSEVDARTDVYALGVTLYEVLCGKPPFEAPTLAELIVRITTDEPIALRKRAPELPVALETVVMHCLAKRRDARYPSAQALADELDRFLAGKPIEASPPGIGARALAAIRRHRVRAALVVAVLAVAAAVAIGVVATRPHARPWQPVIRDLPPVVDENSGGVVISPDGQTMAYDSDRDGTYRVYVAPIAGGTDRAITPPDAYATRPSFSTDGRSVLYAMAGGIYRQPVAGGDAVKILDGVQLAIECGPRLVFSRAGLAYTLWVREPDGHERELARLPDDHFARGLACDRAGQRIVYVDRSPDGLSAPGVGYLADLEAGTPPVVILDQQDGSDHISFHPDGRSVLFTSQDSGARNLWELPLGGGAPTRVTFGGGPDVCAAVTPDGRQLIYDIDQSWIPVYAMPLSGGTPRRITTTLEDVNSLDVSPDGAELVLGVRRAGAEQIAIFGLADGQERIIDADGKRPVYSPDGTAILFVRGSRLMTIPRAGGTAATLAEVPGPIYLVFAGDGAIYIVGRDGDRTAEWRVAAGGGAPERVAVPAPFDGILPIGMGWRGAWSDRGRNVLVPPGAEPGDPRCVTVPDTNLSWPDGAQEFYVGTDDDVHRFDLATGVDIRLFHFGQPPVQFWGKPSPDGKTFYFSQLEGMVRRQVITNFGDRPRPPR